MNVEKRGQVSVKVSVPVELTPEEAKHRSGLKLLT
jgi:hypothetical protein